MSSSWTSNPQTSSTRPVRLTLDSFPFDSSFDVPPNVVSLMITDCTLSSGVDDLFRLLDLLPCLRELSLHGLKGTIPPESLVSQIYTPEYLVSLPHLDHLFLSGELPAQADMLYLLNTSSLTRIKLAIDCVNDSSLETQIQKLSYPFNVRLRRLEPKYNIVELVIQPTRNVFMLRISTQQAADALCILFSSHDPEGRALPIFVKSLDILRSAICLSIRPYDFTSPGNVALELWIDRLRNTLRRLENVETLFVQGDINDIVWDILRRPNDPRSIAFPKLRELAIIGLDGTVTEMVEGLADPPLEECVGWRKDTLRKIIFSECPDLEDSDIPRLTKALDGIAIELDDCRDCSDSDGSSNHTDGDEWE